ncbi:phosphatase PAP2 family protein [Cellulomonas sp. T2.31MG-18]|uniref:phosphatase PAP2 family protein n=1 Tax=Cellulomonas sp. T2.31MG-18 TaxID=3157619 RepID=UPI00366B090C
MSRRRAALVAWSVAAVSAVGVWLLWRVFVDTVAGQQVERLAFDGARFGQTHLWSTAHGVLDVVSTWFIAAALAVSVVVALVRRRWELAVQVAVLVIGANGTTRLLKLVVLQRPHLQPGTGDNTLPSGHTTAAASVSAALLFVVPPRARPWVAGLGGAYTAATGVSTLIGRWHRPSDAVAATLVVLAWTAVACALSTRRSAPTVTDQVPVVRTNGAPSTHAVVLGVLLSGGAAAAVVGALLLVRTWSVRSATATRAAEVLAYAGGVSAVIAASALTFAAMLVLRRATGSLDGRS